ncbi:hypothetical protein C8R45DRAFT_1130576 [Mycena sanguinolenta]|nr:hypothetical protein C8R45DRAFT_1130576 [Mycena sanguinolenta]
MQDSLCDGQDNVATNGYNWSDDMNRRRLDGDFANNESVCSLALKPCVNVDICVRVQKGVSIRKKPPREKEWKVTFVFQIVPLQFPHPKSIFWVGMDTRNEKPSAISETVGISSVNSGLAECAAFYSKQLFKSKRPSMRSHFCPGRLTNGRLPEGLDLIRTVSFSAILKGYIHLQLECGREFSIAPDEPSVRVACVALSMMVITSGDGVFRGSSGSGKRRTGVFYLAAVGASGLFGISSLEETTRFNILYIINILLGIQPESNTVMWKYIL